MRKKVTTSLCEPVAGGFVEKACKLDLEGRRNCIRRCYFCLGAWRSSFLLVALQLTHLLLAFSEQPRLLTVRVDHST